MNRKTILASLVSIVLIGFSSCVELPESEPPRRDATADVRVVYLDPSLPSTVTIRMAAGPTFTTFTNLPTETYANPNAVYRTYPAGAKRLLLVDGSTPVDPDTTSLTFETDQRGTLYVIPKAAGTTTRFVWLSERYVFALPGIKDTARVRVMNAIASFDTIDVQQVSASFPIVDNLRFGRSSSFVKVAAGTTARFYLTHYTSSTAQGDTVTVVGASNKQYTIVAYDSLSAAKFVLFEEK